MRASANSHRPLRGRSRLLLTAARPNSSFNPNPLRSTNNMAGRACHVVGSTTQVGLTQALGASNLELKRFSASATSGGHSTPIVAGFGLPASTRSEEHTSELQSLMRISYAVFCLKKKTRRHKKYTRYI